MGPCLTGAYKLRGWRPVDREISCGPCTGDRVETFVSVPSLLPASSFNHYTLPVASNHIAFGGMTNVSVFTAAANSGKEDCQNGKAIDDVNGGTKCVEKYFR